MADHTYVTCGNGAARWKCWGGDTGDGAPFNILFVLTYQERYFDPAVLPHVYSLSARERLQREGVTFTNHQIATSVRSSSQVVRPS